MTGMAGEPGHINVEPEGHPCNCGSRGCLEQIASATAIKRMATEAVVSGKAPHMAQAMKASPEFSSKVIYDLAMQGDAQAQAIFQRVGNALGTVLADLVNIFNIPMYVIGGGVASAWDAFAPTMMEKVYKNSFVYRATTPAATTPAANSRSVSTITQALLGSDAGLIGAARLPMISRQPISVQKISDR
jgi:glucokinase